MDCWHVVICDDDKTALGIISGAIGQAFRSHEVDVQVELFTRPRELEARMKEVSFDLLLLDIDMPGMDGITFSRQLRRENDLIDIIFISNREDKVFDSLRINPKGFIRKSNFLSDVSGVIDAYFRTNPKKKKSETIVVETADQLIYIALDKLLFIEGQGKEQWMHVTGRAQPVAIRKQMQVLETELEPHGFLRVHKGYLVNHRFIRRIEDAELLLTNGQTVPISRRRTQEIRAQYMSLMQSSGSMIL